MIGLDAVVTLQGDLGTGKTTFVRYLLQGLGINGRVRSPTYALVETYEVPSSLGAFTVSHFDFYRFERPLEGLDAGLREPFEQLGLKLIEWPDRAAAWLPTPDLALTLTSAPDDARSVQIDARTERALPWLAAAGLEGSGSEAAAS